VNEHSQMKTLKTNRPTADWNLYIETGTIKRSSVESENYQMVICGICMQRWKPSSGGLWDLYLEMETIKWSSVGSVPRDGNYQLVVCGICT
jgi:hypothetical protein